MDAPWEPGICEVCGRRITMGFYWGSSCLPAALVTCGEDCLAVEVLRRAGLPRHANILREWTERMLRGAT